MAAPPTAHQMRVRWSYLSSSAYSKELAQKLRCDASNISVHLGLARRNIQMAPMERITPPLAKRVTPSARSFQKAMERYRSINAQATSLASITHTKQAAAVRHLRQASLVLALGSFDAYIRDTVIETYLHVFFETSSRPPDLLRGWTEASKRALLDDQELLVRIAKMQPSEAKKFVTESVYDNLNVRVLTSNFGGIKSNLSAINLDLKIPDFRAGMTPAQEFLYLAPAVFDAYSTARHLIVHVGGVKTNGAVPYCASQEPVTYLESFLEGLVTLIESERKNQSF